MAKTPRDRRATKVGVHSADLPVLPGSSEEKAGRAPKKTWLVDVVDVLLLGLGCPKKDHPTLMLLMFPLMDIVSNKYVNTWCLLSGLPHRRDPWKINGKTPALMFWCHFYHWKSPSQSYWFPQRQATLTMICHWHWISCRKNVTKYKHRCHRHHQYQMMIPWVCYPVAIKHGCWKIPPFSSVIFPAVNRS